MTVDYINQLKESLQIIREQEQIIELLRQDDWSRGIREGQLIIQDYANKKRINNLTKQIELLKERFYYRGIDD